jgi:CRISPR-associated exonuclease Cas4
MAAEKPVGSSPTYTGTQVNYFVVCPRKLWLFSHDVTMEHTSQLVELGQLLHESSYPREHKEIQIERIKIDFSGKEGVIHEIKKSNQLEEAHRYQLLYYLYYLKQKGITGVKGEIDYPKLRKKAIVELTPEAERELEEILTKIEGVLAHTQPPPRIDQLSICKKCSYYELCYV